MAAKKGRLMRVRIGIAETGKVFEIDVDDVDGFRKEISSAIGDGSVAWYTDTKGRTVGVPGKSVAFVEIEDSGTDSHIGFVTAG